MKILVAEKLSQHRYKTPEGYLICVDSVLARTGKQTYRRNEIFADSEDDRLIEVDRKAEEVFSPETMASFENKPICVEHPDVDVTVDNISEFAVGFVRDIHKGEYEGEPVMLGTLVITDAKTIEEIENGEHTDLSCGYDCDIEDCDSPEQKHIRGNHIALCEHGRAGIARIVDSVKDEQLYAVEFVYDGDSWSDYLGHVNVRAKSEQDALTKAKRWAVNRYDNACCFKIASTKYTNVETIDVIKDEESTYTEVTKNLEKEAKKDMSWLDIVVKEKKEEIKDYVPFPKKDALNKSNGLEEIKRIINNKDNTFEDSEGMIYLTEKAYNDIKAILKMYGITQKELEGISKYFFGPGGYNMFR